MVSNECILALVGMPGAGKSEATAFLSSKGIPFIRFGDVTDAGLEELSLPVTPENEQMYREKIRKELGMAAYAKKAHPMLTEAVASHPAVVVDGLYSWEEYTYLKEHFPGLTLIHIYAEPAIRYRRLAARPVRPFTKEEARKRDMMEIERLDKGGPIAIADYLIVNNADIASLHKNIDALLGRLGAAV